jgi:DNA-binding transcriptional regulator YdaS (Cro superfamily)
MAEKLSGIKFAIVKASGARHLADQLGVAIVTVSRWQRMGHVPAERVAQVSRITGIPAYDLAPPVASGPTRPPGGINVAIRKFGKSALAEKLGVAAFTLSRWERRGGAPAHRVQAISRITGVPVKDLLEANPKPRKPRRDKRTSNDGSERAAPVDQH